MADVKRLLVVDDRYEMLDFLQSMLELTSEDYEVVAVPSAEEALLELRQKELDLLITDARLPGMSGFDLVRRMRRSHPDIPAIMITAYSSEQGQHEARDLGVFRYFEKPLDTDEVLTAVHTALYGELIVHADSPTEAEKLEVQVPQAVSKRLETLRADTGATRLALATTFGQILLQLGQGRGLNVSQLSALMARSLDNSLLLAKQLGGDDPTTIQYHAGDRVELYIANVGHDYFLAIFFDAQARRGRMGTIWVFAQRAIKDLLSMLPAVDEIVGTKRESILAFPAESPTRSEEVRSATKPETLDVRQLDERDESVREESPAFVAEDDFPALDQPAAIDSDELDSFWDTAVAKELAGQDDGGEGGLSLEAAKRQGLIEQDLGSHLSEAQTEDVATNKSEEASGMEESEFKSLLQDVAQLEEAANLDSFWETAVAEEEASMDAMSDGVSYEEAKRRGLLSDDSGSDSSID